MLPAVSGRGSGGMAASKDRIFRRYSVFGWGFPLVHAVTALILDLCLPPSSVGTSSTNEFFNPNFGFRTCWFHGNIIHFQKIFRYFRFFFTHIGSRALLVFFYGPIGLLMLCNVALFSLTAFGLKQATMTTPAPGSDNGRPPAPVAERKVIRRYSSNTFKEANYNRER